MLFFSFGSDEVNWHFSEKKILLIFHYVILIWFLISQKWNSKKRHNCRRKIWGTKLLKVWLGAEYFVQHTLAYHTLNGQHFEMVSQIFAENVASRKFLSAKRFTINNKWTYHRLIWSSLRVDSAGYHLASEFLGSCSYVSNLSRRLRDSRLML